MIETVLNRNGTRLLLQQPPPQREFTTQQIKLFFSVLCFITGNFDILEHQFAFLPRSDQAKILLAGTLIENCGIKYLKTALEKSLSIQSNIHECWVAIPNQYTLNDRTWLYPVIRACDPSGDYFNERDYGYNLIEQLSHDFGIELSLHNEKIHVDIYRVMEILCRMKAGPSAFHATKLEVDQVLAQVIGDDITCSTNTSEAYKDKDDPRRRDKVEKKNNVHKKSVPPVIPVSEHHNSTVDDFSMALRLLIFILASFIMTGLLLGFLYCGQ